MATTIKPAFRHCKPKTLRIAKGKTKQTNNPKSITRLRHEKPKYVVRQEVKK